MTYLSAIGFHVILGGLLYVNESLAKVYFLAAIGYFLYRVVLSPPHTKTVEVLQACAYFVGAEVFLRTTRGTITYEAGKYMVMLFMFLGMVYRGISGRGYPYFMYLMFLVPSIFVASTTLSFDANFRTNIAFVLSGPICLGMAALFCYDKRITVHQLNTILLFIALPIIAHTVYIFLYVPNLRDVLQGTSSSRAAAGGWGANQVSGVLGLGMFVMAMRFFTKSPTLGLKLLNAGIFMLMTFRAVTTMSRGGVITAIAAIVVFLLYYFPRVRLRKQNELVMLMGLFALCMVVTWTVSVQQSNGLVNLRYANKDALGREKADVTTGRAELFEEELKGFMESPFFGIGSSRAKDQRIEEEGQGVTSHSEFSRTLAEHGIFGVLILIILIFKPLTIRVKNRRNYYFYAFLVFWFLTINHMSMRIAMPAFVYALALLNITYEQKRPVPRQQLIER